MTTNHDRATAVIGSWIYDNLPPSDALYSADEGIAEALAHDNLITADTVVLDAGDRNFVIDNLKWRIRSAKYHSQTGMVDAWKAAADAFVAHTTTADDTDDH